MTFFLKQTLLYIISNNRGPTIIKPLHKESLIVFWGRHWHLWQTWRITSFLYYYRYIRICYIRPDSPRPRKSEMRPICIIFWLASLSCSLDKVDPFFTILFYMALKTLDTIGNCQRPLLLTVCISTYAYNHKPVKTWTQLLLSQRCVLSDAWLWDHA